MPICAIGPQEAHAPCARNLTQSRCRVWRLREHHQTAIGRAPLGGPAATA
jgi:hypothetical protein